MKNKLLIVIVPLLIFFLVTASVLIIGGSMKRNIVIYAINRESFYDFLEDPSTEIFETEHVEKYPYPKDGKWYITQNTTQFRVQNSLINFVGNNTKIQEYLAQYGVMSEIKNVRFFDTPYVPKTIWVETATEDVFITVNEEVADEPYVYRFYTLSEYTQRHCCIDATLTVRGKVIETSVPVKLHSSTADVPLIPVLKALGGEVEETEEQVQITINGKLFYLDKVGYNLYEFGNETENLLYQVDGGKIYIYWVDRELVVDNAVLISVLRSIGISDEIEFSRENATFLISNLR